MGSEEGSSQFSKGGEQSTCIRITWTMLDLHVPR